MNVMKRYDVFKQIHKGLRALLYETALLLQQTDFSDADEAEIAVQQVTTVIDLFEKHAHTEDSMVFTAIINNEPALVDIFEQEHVEDHALGLHLGNQLAALVAADSFDEKENVGERITQAFIAFMVFNLKHMAKEEDIINKALWKYYSDLDLHGMTQRIVAAVPPQSMALYSRWMIRGLSNNELTNWLKDVKNNAPDFVFGGLMQTAAAELNESRWKLVQEAITEGALMA